MTIASAGMTFSLFSVGVGDRIRKRRKDLGMSQKALADALGISPSAMLKYEKNRVEMGAQRLADTAQLLDVPMIWLATGQGDPATTAPTESRVVPTDEPPLLARARESGHYPDWVLAAVPQFFHHRHGEYSYGELVDFLDKIHDAGKGELEALKKRIGPPKRGE